MVNFKNVTTEPVFTIEKQCDRCRNVLYFSDSVISEVELDEEGHVIYSSIVCPVCGNIIVLYSIKPEIREFADEKEIVPGEVPGS
jgi:ribosomal protein S27AE